MIGLKGSRLYLGTNIERGKLESMRERIRILPTIRNSTPSVTFIDNRKIGFKMKLSKLDEEKNDCEWHRRKRWWN